MKSSNQWKPVPLRESRKYLVITSQDKSAWVVCGHLCAARVSKKKAATALQAIKVAVRDSKIWSRS